MGNDIFSQIHAAATAQAPPQGSGDVFSQIHSEKQGSVSRFNQSFSEGLGAKAGFVDTLKSMGSGLATMATHPIESGKLLLGGAADAQQEVIDKAYQEQQSGDFWTRAKGYVRGAESAIPLVGPLLSKAGDQFSSGDVAGGLGSTAAIAAPILMGKAGAKLAEAPAPKTTAIVKAPSVDPEVVRTQAQAVVEGKMEPALATSDNAAGKMARAFGIKDAPPTKLLTQAIKPGKANFGWDEAIAKAAPDMKAAEIELGRPIAGVDDALSATTLSKKGLWKQYSEKLSSAGEAGASAMIDGNDIADAMVKSIDKRTALQNPQLAERIKGVADTYRRDIPVEEAEDFLQSANNDLNSYYSKNKVGRHVAEKDPATGFVVAEADQLRDSLYSKLEEVTGPGAKDLKARYGALSNVQNELMNRKNVAARQQPESLQEQLTMAKSYGKIAKGVLTASPGDIYEGSESIAASKWLKERGTTDAMITRAFEALGGKSK